MPIAAHPCACFWPCLLVLLAAGDHTGLNRPCYFIDKAYHAQAAGADALLVVNDNPGDLSTAVAPKDEDSSRWASDPAETRPHRVSV